MKRVRRTRWSQSLASLRSLFEGFTLCASAPLRFPFSPGFQKSRLSGSFALPVVIA
jgi:hypothetical protein